MPIITSHTSLAETAVRYMKTKYRSEAHTGTVKGEGSSMPVPAINKPLSEKTTDADPNRPDAVSDLVIRLCDKILASEPELMRQLSAGETEESTLAGLLRQMIEQEDIQVSVSRDEIFQQVHAFLFGYGPLQKFIEDDSVSDIDGNAPDEFTVTREGVREKATLSFPDVRSYDIFCRLVIIRNGGVINENDTHCRVSDPVRHLRINVTVPPRSTRYATISIRKHRQQAYSLDDLRGLGMIDLTLQNLMKSLAAEQRTVLFCGKGAAGKTTALRSFIDQMPPLERVLIAESDSELFPSKPCCLLQKIKKVHEGGRMVTLRDIISDGLTMSLDSYCIGEIVGEEAMEFLHAAFSGHRCLATIHAESAADAIDRLVSLARPASRGEDDKMLYKMAGKCLDFIFFMKDFKVDHVIKINQYNQEKQYYEYETIWQKSANASADTSSGQPSCQVVPGT